MRRLARLVLVGLGASVLTARAADAQYFGRNKVQYRSFDFRIIRTEHFDVYFYPEEATAAQQAARMAERWYSRLSGVLIDTLNSRQPLILYASPTHFRQTNVLDGDIGEGTGGVTESFKRRVIMPLGISLAESDHVLGHELVHAFQYDITTRGRSQAPGASALPLWFIEGMAEYLSLGPHDPFTALWMRDAVMRNELPTIRQLDHPKYFPYRWGQAFWGWIASIHGDEVVGNLLRAAARTRDPLVAIREVVGQDPDSLSAQWHAAMRQAYVGPTTAFAADSGTPVLTKQNTGGRLNVGPALSPDGSRVAFISERDLFSVEVFVADATTGRILRRMTRSARDPHLESIQFIYSSGAWAPDGRRFALATTVRGRATLQVIDADDGSQDEEIGLREVNELHNPTWSADGQKIAFTAQAGGLTDLYVYDLPTRELRRLTNDAFADLMPAWSPDGNTVAFVTDRFGTNLASLSYGRLRLALLDVRTGGVTEVAIPGSGVTTNPQWGDGGRSLFFLGNPDGITNVYRLDVAAGTVTRVTDLPTGAMGIAALSPALAVATNADRMMVSIHRGEQNDIVRFDGAETLAGRPVQLHTDAVTTLAIGGRNPASSVVAYLADPATGLPSTAEFEVQRYRSRLGLDYIAPPSLTAGTDRLGTFVGGGSALFWSSMLGDQQLVTMLQVNGTFKDIAAQVGYVNRKRRFDWGLVAAQIPYLTGGYSRTLETVNGQPAVVDRQVIFRQTSRQIAGLLSYPFSRVQRLETSMGVRHISFSGEERSVAFDANTGQFIGESRIDLPSQPGVTMAEASAALVYDNSLFGGTGPVTGRRWRLEASPTFGTLNFVGALADIRQYLMPVRPITFAGRVLHFGRYGSDSEDPRMQQLFLGYQSLVRGYDNNSFDASECPSTGTTCPAFDQLLGSRILVGNAEMRLPLLGPLGILARRVPIPADLVFFADAGVAWVRGENPRAFGGTRPFVSSVGTALRVNILGMLIAELDLVRPLDRPGKGWFLQLGLTQGGF